MPIAWTTARRIAASISTGLVILSIQAGYEGWRQRSAFEAATEARPLEGVADFSKPGSITLPLTHDFPAAHGVEINLLLPKGHKAEASLARLEAHLELFGVDGRPILEKPADASPLAGEVGRPELVRLFYLGGLDRGDYTARITVAQPADDLRGTHQELYGSYLLCGLEALPSLISFLLGAALAVAAGTIVALTFHFSKPRAVGVATKAQKSPAGS